MRRRDLIAQWRRDLDRLEESLPVLAGADAARVEGMIAAYRRVLADAA